MEKIKLEQRHFERIKDITNNLESETGILVTGLDKKDCVKYKTAADILGYDVKPHQNFTDDRGYPLAYDLEKRREYSERYT